MFGNLTRVGSNYHAEEAWNNLKALNGKIGQVQSRLSTGKRINSAEDDTSGYALAKNLEGRTRGLSQALDNVGTAKNVLNIAEGGFQSQMSLLQTMKEKATQAADGSWSGDQRQAIHDQFAALRTEFDKISEDTLFNSSSSLFSSTALEFQVGAGASDQLSIVIGTSVATSVGEGSTDISTLSLSAAGDAQTAIGTLDTAIGSLAKSVQNIGDYNARLSSKEESLSLAISNTEATRSRIEDADFAKEQMSMMKLSILQQTAMGSFAQANSSSQMVLSLFQ
ncbi:MAG: flagellin [Candidatus Marinimicrobia bacterium]|nr:flagellin [Candidatus Neomarinimicrobiota bacterium]|tara:strand:- start:10670 stop:11509 length:840 start_codon:yes stop_codon:yes gene_type:complete